MPHPTAPGYEDDALLVAAVLRGDMEAFKKLINLYEKLVISIVFKMVHRVEDSEDLCQDIFLKVYEKLNTFHFQSKLSTLLIYMRQKRIVLPIFKHLLRKIHGVFNLHINDLFSIHYRS